MFNQWSGASHWDALFSSTMLLREALGLEQHEIVAAVGAGGKTSILQRLAGEMAAQGASVVSTTTTHIWQPAAPCIIEPDQDALLAAVAAAARPGQVLTVASERRYVAESAGGPQRSKLTGIAAHLPGRLLALPGVDCVLVEADGGRGRAIKAPSEHEPVIPPDATLVLAVVGIEAVGEPLTGEIAHRPERLAALLGVEPGTLLHPQQIAALLMHPQGGRKGVPPAARFVPVINKVQTETALHAARAILARLRSQPGIDAVLITAALGQQPVLEVWRA